MRVVQFFFNLRYFEQVFADDLDTFLCRIINFYFFLTMCHELMHNRHSGHHLDFISNMQLVVVKYMPSKDNFHLKIIHHIQGCEIVSFILFFFFDIIKLNFISKEEVLL